MPSRIIKKCISPFRKEIRDILFLCLFLFFSLMQRSRSDAYQAFNNSVFYVCTVVVLFFYVNQIIQGQRTVKFSYIGVFSLLLYVFFVTTELYRGTNIIISDEFWTLTSIFVLFSVVRKTNFSPSRLNLIANLLICTAFILGMIGLSQFYSYMELQHGFLGIKGGFSNVNSFTAYLCIALPFSVQRLIRGERKSSILNLMCFLNVFLLFFICFVTLSRMSLLISICILVLMPVIRKIKRLNKKKIVIFATLFLMGLFMLSRLVKKDSSQGRLLIWKVASIIPLESPWLGVGAGKFKALYNGYQAQYFSNRATSEDIRLASETFSAFNEPLEILIEHGIFGLLGIGTLLCVTLRPKQIPRSIQRNDIEAPFLISAISGLAIGMVSHPFSELAILVLFTLNLSVCASFRVLNRVRILPYLFRLRSSNVIVVILIVGIICGLSYRFFYLQRWYNLANSIESTEIQLQHYNKLHKHMRHDGVFLLYYAKQLLINNQYEASLEKYTESKNELSTIIAELESAKIYSRLGFHENAEIHFKRACDMTPNRFMPKYLYFLYLIDMGKKEHALKLGKQIVEMPVKVNSVKVDIIIKNVRRYMDEIVQ